MRPESRIYTGDCRAIMRHMLTNDYFDGSFDSIITDPPYEIGFMGKAWDKSGVSYDPATWELAFKLLKPGGHLLAFGGARTYHRIACAIENAGFDIRDQIMWIYGSGFPKSKNLDGDWDGWGTALKPAHEPIVVARKPFEGAVLTNVLQHGTGALNIDACRIAVGDEQLRTGTGGIPCRHDDRYARNGSGNRDQAETLGRWPANVAHDGSDEVLAAFPDAPGQIANASSSSSRKTQNTYGAMKRGNEAAAQCARGDTGSAARFFYCAKASRTERNAGLAGWDKRPLNWSSGELSPGTFQSENTDRMVENYHPTVKPISLMRWLCRLVTPPGGTVLDIFSGSGTTGCAAALEGFSFIGIDERQEYVDIAQARIRYWNGEVLL